MSLKAKKILITGSNGFIGKNLLQRLSEIGCQNIATYNRENNTSDLKKLTKDCDIIYHLAGENRPVNEEDFDLVNFGLTRKLCDILANETAQRRETIHLVYISSAQFNLPTKYGVSKKKAESEIETLSKIGVKSTIFRLPGVFGKWAKPNYNSVVATFCHNIANSKPIEIHDPEKKIELVYIDDVIDSLVEAPFSFDTKLYFDNLQNVYTVNIKDLAAKIQSYFDISNTLEVAEVGEGFERALYSTYLSYLPPNQFKYQLPVHCDERGVFVEMLKTTKCGQFSFFTAHAGVTRGGHYHNTKNEKFLVIQGKAKFRFRNIINSEKVEFETSSEFFEIVDTVPGWAHDITNIGNELLVVMLWANEIFDPHEPDTHYSAL